MVWLCTELRPPIGGGLLEKRVEMQDLVIDIPAQLQPIERTSAE
jgi:hypothetical protein